MDQDTTPAARAWQLLADGATTTQIARALGIPPSAVEPLLDQARAAQPEPATCQLNRGAAAAEAPADPKRAAYIDGLRQLADVLEAHAELPLPYEGSRTAMTFFFLFSEDPRAAMAAAVRALPCNLVKNFSGYDDGPSYLDLSGQLGGLKIELTARRDDVCTRRVTGTEDREVEEVVTPAVKRTVTKAVEVVEWDCHPIMADPERTAVSPA